MVFIMNTNFIRVFFDVFMLVFGHLCNFMSPLSEMTEPFPFCFQKHFSQAPLISTLTVPTKHKAD